MIRKNKCTAAEAHLQPLALTVIFTSFAVAALLVGTVSTGFRPTVAGAYEINVGR